MYLPASSAFNRDAGGYLALTPTPIKLQLDDSPLSVDSPITIEPPPQLAELIDIPRPSHPMPSSLVVSLYPTHLTLYALTMLSVLASTTRLLLINVPYVTRPSSAGLIYCLRRCYIIRSPLSQCKTRGPRSTSRSTFGQQPCYPTK